jgi:uncharacterized zinc-type alcohol dehydrogenase-like protein
MVQSKGYAAQSSDAPLAPHNFSRREPDPNDVQMDILFCGVCHSDLHQVRDDWGGSVYPVVPGHEIIGRVTKVGNAVKKFKVGDLAAIGCMVDSCRSCPSCTDGLEQYCTEGCTWTYNSPDRKSDGMTMGGYSNNIVADEAFVLKVPESLDPAAAAPLLCAGITTYSPLRHWNISKGHKVGVVGLGGLGHMALKFAKAFGAEVVLFTTSPGKTEDAKRLGADEVIISKNEEAMAAQAGTFDFILDTVSAIHDIRPYLHMLKREGTLTLVGIPAEPLEVGSFDLALQRRRLAGSAIGSIAETQEMLDFCAKHNIVSDIEMIPISNINEAYERMLKSDVKYRFVIDMATL